MQMIGTVSDQASPGSVPVVTKARVYYSTDIEAVGSIDAFMKQIGNDQPKLLPKLDISEDEWNQLLHPDA